LLEVAYEPLPAVFDTDEVMVSKKYKKKKKGQKKYWSYR